MHQILNTALDKASKKDNIKLSESTINDALQIGDLNKDKQIQFAEFCNILLNLHVFYAIEKK